MNPTTDQGSEDDAMATVTALDPSRNASYHTTPPREDRDWITTAELVTEAGNITYRQADYWIRTGLLHTTGPLSPGTGAVRTHPQTEAARARTIRDLIDAGLSLERIREAIEALAGADRAATGGSYVTVTAHATITITYEPHAAAREEGYAALEQAETDQEDQP